MILKSIKSLFVFILCLASMPIFSQLQNKVSQNGAHTELYFNNPVKTTSTFSKVIGSPYLNEKFLPASVNKSKMTYFVRFNAVENNIEFRGENDVIMTLPKSDVYEIKLLDGSNKEYETHSFKDEDKGVSNTFFEKIYIHHDFVIYLKENIYFTPVRLAKHSFEAHRPGKFTKAKETFYATDVTSESEKLTELPKKEKQFVALFGEHAARIKQFIKKEKLEIDTKEDLIKIMKFYHNQ
ncbi:MAG: hypothetical protein ACJART_000208 [Maribacter sp.]|jgi:hypothetical protein